MAQRFDSFIMFAEMRTGSNFLEANLNALDGVTCHGEVFNPYFIGKKDQVEAFGLTLADRENDPISFLKAMRQQTTGLAGFRYFNDHDPRVFDAVMADRRCAKIVLTRNPVESYVSWKIARETGQWKLTNPKNLKTAKAEFDGVEFEKHLERIQAFQIKLLHALQISGQTAFYVDYEDIGDVDVINGLAAWLGVDARLDAPDSSLTVQNPEPIEAKVVDPTAMEQALARLDRFNLSRTPNFEPRRSAAIPGYVAAQNLPLIYMPIKGGPVDQVSDWLGQFGGLERDFVQKTLRQWKRARPGFRSFTVLRHPLERAHAAFLAVLAGGMSAEQRGVMTRVHKVEFPKNGLRVDEPARHAAAFLAFLKFLKRNLSGQTGFRTDGGWASQSAVIQGFSQFGSPDLLLRQDRLASGLEYLCAELGVTCPDLPDATDDNRTILASIYSPEIEDACREAYQRDYMTFGFGNWA